MKAHCTRLLGIAAVLASVAAAGCGDVARQGRTPAQLVIVALEGASGAQDDEFSGTLLSDVVTLVTRTVNGQQQQVPTIFNDLGRVKMSMVLRDLGGAANPSAPSSLNQITISRYRVSYRRADGRNTPGVDVPYAFDSALTFTVPASGEVSASFDIVRHTAKKEAPLAALGENGVLVNTIAEVTFYGRDQAGNEVAATGTIGITFGNFADPS